MGTLTTIKFDGSHIMHEHVIEMTNITAKLKSLGMNVDENFLMQFIINSLPSKYIKAQVEAIGTYRLILDTRHHLDLFQTLYVPSVSCNLVSLLNLI
ncbi:hypothetical protein ACOSP7_019321 [Xanthoceras sorbifolium]